MVFGNRVLGRILGPMRVGVRGGWKKLHNKELQNLYFWPNSISIIPRRRSCRTNGKEEKFFQSLGRKTTDQVNRR
jgi:hypothetical protein